MSTTYTLRLDEIDGTHVAVGGGKGASLGELVHAGIPVPAGFVVTRPAFDAFMASADPEGRVASWLAEVESGGNSPADAAKAIAEFLAGAPIPEDISSAIQSGVDSLAADRVSVRSSATCEDGTATAWAGQLETFLDIKPAEVVSQVKQCWLSIYHARALAYGAAHGYGGDQFGVAVVVQQMVASEVSGIGFSVHPVTQEPDLRLIEACFGLGEAIVSGTIVPDQFVVKRGAKEIVESVRGNQRQGLFLEPNQPEPQWRDLGPRGAEAKLTEAQVLEYAKLLDQIEDHYGFPVDTEWALAEGRFQVLQARPITTLAKEYREAIVDTSESWWRGFRRPLALLEASIISHWVDSRHSGAEFDFHLDRFMAIEDASDLTTMFYSPGAFDAAVEHIRTLDKTDRPRLIAILERGVEFYRQEHERIEHGESFASFDEAAERLVEIGKYTTSFPAMTLMALDAGHIDDPRVRELAEQLRSHSLYPPFASKLINPMAQAWVKDLGFSEPDRAQHLVTWRELHQESIDLATLEGRLEAIQQGYRYVYQMLGEEERVDFVSETGYLLMREAGQRQMVPTDDPDCLSGMGAWPGVHRGRAKVVLSSEPEGYELEDGDVLVSIQSNPNLMPLLRHAGAIVTDDGGVACHAGIICRELKIPTIIGTERATSVIHDGDLVEVDAIDQVVRILERAGGK
ncbi:PEP/pyruvate-binding domain-containing protein [Aeoliella sp.]|uniref:PEP/pyruvate-binding domain-containing protein n=1 Tax=Aeoliella sp. TaxID=2795800 RepID=UPI003CCB7504